MSGRPATIVRVQERRGYVRVDRRAFEDARLSWAARGIFGYLLVKPDDWEINVTDLRRRGNLGKDGVYRALAELVRCGYLRRRRERDASGRYRRTVYTLYEVPRPDMPDAARPQAAPPEPDAPAPVEPTLPTNHLTRETDQPLRRETTTTTEPRSIRELTAAAHARILALHRDAERASARGADDDERDAGARGSLADAKGRAP